MQALTGLASGASGGTGARRALNDIAATAGPDGPALAAAGLGHGLAAVSALPLPMAQKK